jgi:hypothetical protein
MAGFSMKSAFTVHRALGILGVALAACSGHDKAAATSAMPPVQWDDATDEALTLPTGAPVLVPGEQLIWRLTLHGLEIGELALATGVPGQMDGRKLAVVRSRVRTRSAASLFSSLQHDVTTFIDVHTAQPTYHRRELTGGNELSWVEAKLGAGEFDITYRDRQGKEHTEHQVMPRGAAPLDSNALLVALRGWNPRPDERAVVHVLRETRVWTMQLVVGGHEQVTTALGTFAAIRFDGVSRRMGRDGIIEAGVAPSGYSLWVSDDARRLPLSIAAATDLGDVRMELIHHDIQGGAP